MPFTWGATQVGGGPHPPKYNRQDKFYRYAGYRMVAICAHVPTRRTVLRRVRVRAPAPYIRTVTLRAHVPPCPTVPALILTCRTCPVCAMHCSAPADEYRQGDVFGANTIKVLDDIPVIPENDLSYYPFDRWVVNG